MKKLPVDMDELTFILEDASEMGLMKCGKPEVCGKPFGLLEQCWGYRPDGSPDHSQ